MGRVLRVLRVFGMRGTGHVDSFQSGPSFITRSTKHERAAQLLRRADKLCDPTSLGSGPACASSGHSLRSENKTFSQQASQDGF